MLYFQERIILNPDKFIYYTKRQFMNRLIVLIPAVYIILFTLPDVRADSHEHSVKCGTPEAVRQFFSSAAKRTVYRRPDLVVSALSSEGHFRVHYDTTGYHKPDMIDSDSNGIPDWIDSTLVYLEYAWDLEVDQLGYDVPYTDSGSGGGDEIDVYLWNFGSGSYGITQPERNTDGNLTAYILIDNDYAESQYATHGYDAL